MRVSSESFSDGDVLPDDFAFCVPDPDDHATFGPNRNPHLGWLDVPVGTRSFAIACIDTKAPTVGDDVNQEGRTVAADLPRTDFVHWLIADLPPDLSGVGPGEFSAGVTPRGKDVGTGPYGATQGTNDYTGWFAGDTDMEGTYLGYAGPCPPWNDALAHEYVFTVYALDVAKSGLPGGFSRSEMEEALDGHVLAEGSIKATYSLNPAVQ